MEHRPWHRHYDYNVSPSMRYPRMPLHGLVRIAAGSFPDKAAIDYLGCRMTFAELRSQVVAMASSLEALGIQKGDRVALQLPNCPQYVIAYYATLSVGAIVVNVNPMLTAPELAGIVRDTRPTVLITFDLLAEAAHQVREAEGLSHVIVTGLGDYAGTPNGAVTGTVELADGWHQFVTLVHEAPGQRWPRVEIDPTDPAVILYTGGTTGVPKGAVLTHANMVAATLQTTAWGNPYAHLDPIERRSVLGPLPMFHAYGNVCLLNWGLFNCATQILVPRVEIDELVELIDRVETVSFFPAVPTMLIGILKPPEGIPDRPGAQAPVGELGQCTLGHGGHLADAGSRHLLHRGVRDDGVRRARDGKPADGNEQGGQYRHPVHRHRRGVWSTSKRASTRWVPASPGSC